MSNNLFIAIFSSEHNGKAKRQKKKKDADAPCLEAFKASLDQALSNLMGAAGVPAHCRGVALDGLSRSPPTVRIL